MGSDYMYRSHFFISSKIRTLKLFLWRGYRKQCCEERGSADLSSRSYFSSFGWTPRNGVAGSCGGSVLVVCLFEKPLCYFPQWLHHFTFPSYVSCSLLKHLTQLAAHSFWKLLLLCSKLESWLLFLFPHGVDPVAQWEFPFEGPLLTSITTGSKLHMEYCLLHASTLAYMLIHARSPVTKHHTQGDLERRNSCLIVLEARTPS